MRAYPGSRARLWTFAVAAPVGPTLQHADLLVLALADLSDWSIPA